MDGALYRGAGAGAMYTGNRKGGAHRWGVWASADYKVRFEEWQSRKGAGRRCTPGWAPQCLVPLGTAPSVPAAAAQPCGLGGSLVDDAVAETPHPGLGASRRLRQGQVAMSVSRAAKQAGVGLGQCLAQLWSGLLRAGWERGWQGWREEEGEGVTSELQAPLNKSSL